MADKRSVDPLDPLDGAIHRAMSVEPSPEFLPRIRARVERERISRGAAGWQRLTLGVALAVVILLAAQMPRPGSAPPVATPIARRAAVDIRLPPQAPPATAAGAAERPTAPRPVRRPETRSGSLPSDAPVVIVDERQRAAVSAFMRMVGEGRVTAEAFAEVQPQPTGAIRDGVVPVGVAPVEVNAIAVGGVLQIEPERK
jgi:hypothetical protein